MKIIILIKTLASLFLHRRDDRFLFPGGEKDFIARRAANLPLPFEFDTFISFTDEPFPAGAGGVHPETAYNYGHRKAVARMSQPSSICNFSGSSCVILPMYRMRRPANFTLNSYTFARLTAVSVIGPMS